MSYIPRARDITITYCSNFLVCLAFNRKQTLAFQVHSGEFVQIRNNHWCVISAVGCGEGVVYVSLSSATVRIIANYIVLLHSSQLTNYTRNETLNFAR